MTLRPSLCASPTSALLSPCLLPSASHSLSSTLACSPQPPSALLSPCLLPSAPHPLSSAPVCSPQSLSLMFRGSFSSCFVCLPSLLFYSKILEKHATCFALPHLEPQDTSVSASVSPPPVQTSSVTFKFFSRNKGGGATNPFPLATPEPLTTQLPTPHFQNEVSCGLMACCRPLMIYSPALCTSLCPREPDPMPYLPSELVTLSSIH